MNEYCKDVLMHAWGSSPERKTLEKTYNKQYYSRNRNKLLQRAIERKHRLASGANRTRASTQPGDVLTAPLHYYDGPDDFNQHASQGLKKIAKAIKKVMSLPVKQAKWQLAETTRMAVKLVQAGRFMAEPVKKVLKKSTTAIKKFFKGIKDTMTSDFVDS